MNLNLNVRKVSSNENGETLGRVIKQDALEH